MQWADAVISTGDIANRMEGTDERLIPSATECWDLFEKQYINGVSLKDRAGKAAEVLAIPGNHDVTNAVGFYKAMTPCGGQRLSARHVQSREQHFAGARSL